MKNIKKINNSQYTENKEIEKEQSAEEIKKKYESQYEEYIKKCESEKCDPEMIQYIKTHKKEMLNIIESRERLISIMKGHYDKKLNDIEEQIKKMEQKQSDN